MRRRRFSRGLILVFLWTNTSFSRGADVHPGAVDQSFVPASLSAEFNYLVSGWGDVIGMDLGPNDEIHIGGHFNLFSTTNGWKNWNGVARLHSDGRLDESFAIPQYSWDVGHIDAHDVFVTDDRSVWVGWTTFGKRYSSNGMVVPVTPAAFPTKIYRDGRFLVLSGDQFVRRLSNGAEDSSFHPFQTRGGVAPFILKNGKLLSEKTDESTTILEQRLEDGRLDASFQALNLGTTRIRLLAEAPNGAVYVNGRYSETNTAKLRSIK